MPRRSLACPKNRKRRSQTRKKRNRHDKYGRFRFLCAWPPSGSRGKHFGICRFDKADKQGGTDAERRSFEVACRPQENGNQVVIAGGIDLQLEDFLATSSDNFFVLSRQF
jgi:hypothetical protein